MLFITDIALCQNFNSIKVDSLIKVEQFNEAIDYLNKIDTIKISNHFKALRLYQFGVCYFNTDNRDKAFGYTINAEKLFDIQKNIEKSIDCRILKDRIYSYQNNLDSQEIRHKILSEIEELSSENGLLYPYAYTYRTRGALAFKNDSVNEALYYFRKIIPIAQKINDTLKIASAYQNISLVYEYTNPKRIDSAIYYSKLAEKLYRKFKDNSNLSYNYNNRAWTYKDEGNCKMAIVFFKKADSVPTKKNNLSDKILFSKNLSESYVCIGDYKNAYRYFNYHTKIKDSLKQIDQNIAISDLDKKYKTVEKDKKILQNEILITKNKNLLLGSLLFILFSGTISFLSLKNSKRKRKLAEQQKELETQKNITFLKEQELTTINAMVEGQEKERKRVAEDLHDNLGSVLATLKLHFENLKMNKEKKKINQDELFNKTENLIDEAYLKVRRIAHAKNAGVIANQGLLVAVQMMAEKISSADKIKIDVIDFGLDIPIENSLEITVFRIIQELTTNILKHAEAKNATINVSLYDKNLNIIIEDDGKGFAINKVNLKDGMGLNSIKTRIAHLNGTFDVDSTVNKGTSILINIPIT